MKLIDTLKANSPRWYAALEKHSGRAFWLFAFAQLILWTLLPALFFTNLPLDVIELLSWGHEWQLGYSKHPPMPAWILEALAYVSDRADWTAYFASQLSIMIAYWAIWQLGRETLGEMAALLSVLLTSLIFYYHLPTIEFNHNVLQIPVWALLGLFGWRALRDDRLGDWLLVGLFAGLSIYIKYSQAIMVLALLSFALLHAQTRPRFKGVGLWTGMMVALLVALPHLLWMFNTDFQSLLYASGRAKALVGVKQHILGPLKFLLAQFGNHGGLLLVVVLGGAILPMDRRRGIEPVSFSCDDLLARRYLLWIALAPVLFAAFLSLTVGMKFRSMWGAPMFSFSALALMVWLKPFLFKERFGFMAASWLLLHAGLLLALVLMGSIGSHYSKKPLRTDYPGRHIGEHFSQLWRARTGSPLSYVDGNEWIGGNIAYYAFERPTQLSALDPQARPWTDRQQVLCKGALVVWRQNIKGEAQIPVPYGKAYKTFAHSGVATFPWKVASAPIHVGWAISSPNKGCK